MSQTAHGIPGYLPSKAGKLFSRTPFRPPAAADPVWVDARRVVDSVAHHAASPAQPNGMLDPPCSSHCPTATATMPPWKNVPLAPSTGASSAIPTLSTRASAFISTGHTILAAGAAKTASNHHIQQRDPDQFEQQSTFELRISINSRGSVVENCMAGADKGRSNLRGMWTEIPGAAEMITVRKNGHHNTVKRAEFA